MNPMRKKLLSLTALLSLAGSGLACSPTEEAKAEAQTFACADHPGMGEAVATVPETLDFRECFVRTQESPAGNRMADVMWWALQDNHWSAEVTGAVKAAGTRFYLENTGAMQLKTVLPAGEICATGYHSKTPPGEGDLAAGKAFHEVLTPFRNHVVLVRMARSKLKQVLERSFAINESTSPAVAYPNTTGSFLVPSSNVKISVDFTDYQSRAQVVQKPTTTRPGNLVVSLTVDGETIDLNSDAPITFATNSFVSGVDLVGGNPKEGTVMGEGGGVAAGLYSDYFSNKQPPATNEFIVLDLGKDGALPTTLSTHTALKRYLEAHKTLAPGTLERFSYAGPVPELNLCL